ncbi:hypothetical protein [Streptomyces canus]
MARRRHAFQTLESQ